ncbi:MAG: protein disulfide oxidoreductase [Saccharofermentanales bacterium]
MKILDQETEQQLTDLFAALQKDITLAVFTDGDCMTCPETRQFMEEISGLSDKIHYSSFDIRTDIDEVALYNIEMVPSIVLLDAEGRYSRVKFNGIPAGHEVNSFLFALLEVAGVVSEVPPELESRIRAISRPVNIKVFVTLSCPYCSEAVQIAHKLAMMNPNIVSEMIEAQTFPELSSRFAVSAVPKTMINDSIELLGSQPIEAYLDAIESMK